MSSARVPPTKNENVTFDNNGRPTSQQPLILSSERRNRIRIALLSKARECFESGKTKKRKKKSWVDVRAAVAETYRGGKEEDKVLVPPFDIVPFHHHHESTHSSGIYELDNEICTGSCTSTVIFVAPISPSPNEVITSILPKLGLNKSSLLIDLGCGDGRWMIEASQKTGCYCIGCDIDQDRLEMARTQVQSLCLMDRVELCEVDVFDFCTEREDDLRRANVIVLYLFRDAMQRMSDMLRSKLLRRKRQKELPPQCATIQHETNSFSSATSNSSYFSNVEDEVCRNNVVQNVTIVCVGFSLPSWRTTWQDTYAGLRVYVYQTNGQRQEKLL